MWAAFLKGRALTASPGDSPGEPACWQSLCGGPVAFQRTRSVMGDTARPRDLCIFGSWPNASVRGGAGGWQRLTGNIDLAIDLFLPPAWAEQDLAPLFEGNWLWKGPKQSSVCQVPVEMPGEALQSLQPTLCPAPGAVLSILLRSLVIKPRQDSVLLKAALEKCQQKIRCNSTHCSESSWD